jgi:hypothetical protein
MSSPIHIAVENVQFYIRNRTLRLPFRYGKACLTAAPLLHCRVEIAGAAGVSADMLPPKWFDKSPDKTFRNNIDELVHAAKLGENAYRTAGATPSTPFQLWLAAEDEVRREAANAKLNGLTASFGISILERAVFDAACRLTGTPFHQFIRDNAAGVDPERVHPELAGMRMRDCIPAAPLDRIAIRHTVGFADPIRDAEIDPVESDPVPRTVEGWIKNGGVRYFKIKVSADTDADAERLEALAALFNDTCADGYHVSLDGNEQFSDLAALERWYAAMRDRPALSGFLERVLYIEQPIERSEALERPVNTGGANMPPLVIDESDEHPDTFKRAQQLGYRGCSVKNCKGVIPALLNAMLVHRFNEDEPGAHFLTSEDLCNQTVVPLQQDLCTASTLGIAHSERNGHHYGGVVDHLAATETDDCLNHHGDLYTRHGMYPLVHIEKGHIAIGSIHHQGFGVATMPDFDSMTPLNDWVFEQLNVEDA